MTAEQLWAKFCHEKGIDPTTEYEAWQFGDDPDKLLSLVLSGDKTATCSSFEPYEIEGESLPQVGEYSIVLNSVGAAKCVICTTKVYTLPFSQVSAAHAYKEGEGDKSYAYWRRVHEDFFTKELAEYGLKFNEDITVVCEEFELVYQVDNI